MERRPEPVPARTRERNEALALFAPLPWTYDRMGALLSFGQDPRWRRFMVSRVGVPPGGLVLDVATGTGLVARALASRTGGSVIGLDQSEPMVRRGVVAARRDGLDGRVRFLLGEADRLPFPGAAFDAVTFTYLLRYVVDPPATLVELSRVLRPGGVLANLEFHLPASPWWRSAWLLYTRLGLPALGAVRSRHWYEVGRFLGPSISSFYGRYPLAEQLSFWRAAGIGDVRARVMSLGGGVVIWGSKGGS